MTARIRTVAVVGPDGAGKSALVAALPASLPVPSATVYLGVNLEASRSMLPTTRLALALKRRGSGRPDLTGRFEAPVDGPGGVRRAARRTLRLVAWIAEEWYRAALVALRARGGRLVLCDRHFLCDYYAADVAPRPGRSLLSRIHGWQLGRFYPRPDLVLVLDAPPEVLHARKGEDSLESLAGRRADYLALKDVLPAVEVIDADRPFDEVLAAATAVIAARIGGVVTPGGTRATSEAA